MSVIYIKVVQQKKKTQKTTKMKQIWLYVSNCQAELGAHCIILLDFLYVWQFF